MPEHCKDCCCARSWKALGITEYTGKSIPEHILEIQVELKDKNKILECASYLLNRGQTIQPDSAFHEDIKQALKGAADENIPINKSAKSET